MKIKSQQDVFFDEDPYFPDHKDFTVKSEHFARYIFARNFIKSKKVNGIYNVSSGSGYGVNI